jgi:hypothetical protein
MSFDDESIGDLEPYRKEIQQLLATIHSKVHRPVEFDSFENQLSFSNYYVGTCALVFLDGPEWIKPRPPNHVYQAVKDYLDRNHATTLAHVERLRPYLFHENLEAVPRDETDETLPHWGNDWFTGIDARALYATVAAFKPSRIIEIGSGNSTKFSRKAISDFGLNTKLVCIDPQPRTSILKVADQIEQKSMIEVDAGIFESLRENDILFLDGSHLVFNGTDCTRFFLEILPAVRPGVLVHVHDIMLPFEYNGDFSRMHFAEQYMLASLFTFSDQWQPLWPAHYLAQTDSWNRLFGKPNMLGGLSFWMKRSAP